MEACPDNVEYYSKCIGGFPNILYNLCYQILKYNSKIISCRTVYQLN